MTSIAANETTSNQPSHTTKKTDVSDMTSQVNQLKKQGVKGIALFERVAQLEVEAKQKKFTNRCSICWHDQTTRCICSHLTTLKKTLHSPPVVNIKFLILMHYKEYFNAGNTAKLLFPLLGSNMCELYIYGIQKDWMKFKQELSINPHSTFTLWPGKHAIDLNTFFNREDNEGVQGGVRAGVKRSTQPTQRTSEPSPALLRVVVLDGVYNHANAMLKGMRKRLPQELFPQTVALHPSKLYTSNFHRAQKKYGREAANRVKKSSQKSNSSSSSSSSSSSVKLEALRISTVEAISMLLSDLGEHESVVNGLVQAVEINDNALIHSLKVRPKSGLPKSFTSGAAKMKRAKKEKEKESSTMMMMTVGRDRQGEEEKGVEGREMALSDAVAKHLALFAKQLPFQEELDDKEEEERRMFFQDDEEEMMMMKCQSCGTSPPSLTVSSSVQCRTRQQCRCCLPENLLSEADLILLRAAEKGETTT